VDRPTAPCSQSLRRKSIGREGNRHFAFNKTHAAEHLWCCDVCRIISEDWSAAILTDGASVPVEIGRVGTLSIKSFA
jgi:hypothetical protein